MTPPANPVLDSFLREHSGDFVFAQVAIRVVAAGVWELRHVADASAEESVLTGTGVDALRAVAQFTASGAFRPLKAAPNLRRGWRAVVRGVGELESALNQLYPGALADWYAAGSGTPPVTHFRAFTERQTGMYRIATSLDDAQASAVAVACCDARFCLRRRLWTVGGLASDAADSKSLIPCLEPCALLLELARRAARSEQEETLAVALAPEEAATIVASLEMALENPDASVREGDLGAAINPRRVRLALEKLRPILGVTKGGGTAE